MARKYSEDDVLVVLPTLKTALGEVDNRIKNIEDGSGGSISLLIAINASEGYEGKTITAKSKVDSSSHSAKVESGTALIEVEIPGRYEITNDLNDKVMEVFVGEPLIEEVYLTEIEGTITVTVPEMFIGETIQAVNGVHEVEKVAESTSVVLDVAYEGSWEVGVKGTEYIVKQTVEISREDSSKSCTFEVGEGVPYVTVTLAPEFIGEEVVFKNESFTTKKTAKAEKIQFLAKELGEYTICLEQSENVKETVNVNEVKEFTAIFNLIDTVVPILVVYVKEDDNGREIKATKGETQLTRTARHGIALFVLTEQGTWSVSCDSFPDNTKTINISSNRAYELVYRANIFGIIVTQDESDPKQRVAVDTTSDLEGLKPISVNTLDGTVDYGDMEDTFLFKAMNHVVLKSIDKQEEIELDPNDYTKKLDGSPAPDATLASNYNTFARVDKLYMYEYSANGYEYYYISDRKVDDNYTAVGFTKENGSEADSFYMATYMGQFDSSNRLRSCNNSTVRTNTNFKDFQSAAKRNGTGYYMDQHQILNFYQVAYLMMAQTFLCKEAIGSGRGFSGNLSTDKMSSVATTGFANDKGPIAYDTEGHGIKFMHVEDLWLSSNWICLEGWLSKESKIYAKMNPPYLISGSSDISTYTQVLGAHTYHGNIKWSTVDNKWGRVPAEIGGNFVTYECGNYMKSDTELRPCICNGNQGLFSRDNTYFDSASTSYYARITLLY